MHTQQQRHYEEDDSLLPPEPEQTSRPYRSRNKFDRLRIGTWKAHPYWLLPVVFFMSVSRGITMAPRIKTYTDIACRVLNDESSQQVSTFFVDCGSSEVNGRAAKIQASVVTIMSVLSAFVTGPWSRLGDTQGRKLILCFSLFGALAMDFAFIMVSYPETFPGRYAEQFILAGPILDGLVGGLSTFNGVVHAYASDCTRHGSRSKIFSTIQGIVFVGLALGPWLSGFLLVSTESNVTRYYLSASSLGLVSLYVIFLCPESNTSPRPLSVEQQLDASSTLFQAAKHHATRLAKVLISPIAMFAPRPVRDKPRRKNYNMPLVGLGLFIYLVSTAVYNNKYIYARYVYKWTTDQLGHYMSLLWITRAFNLLIFLPIVISYLKPKSTTPAGEPPSAKDIAAELRFDNYLGRTSLAVDGLADFLVATTPRSTEVSFIAFSCLSSMTSGGNPALHSLGAVCLHACGYSSEVGTLFGAMAVLSAAAHIFSPSLFAYTFNSTVGTHPQSIFFLAAGLLFTAVLILSAIQPTLGLDVGPHDPVGERERLLSPEEESADLPNPT